MTGHIASTSGAPRGATLTGRTATTTGCLICGRKVRRYTSAAVCRACNNRFVPAYTAELAARGITPRQTDAWFRAWAAVDTATIVRVLGEKEQGDNAEPAASRAATERAATTAAPASS